MKNLILILSFFLLTCVELKSQDYIPLVQEGATWIYYGYGEWADRKYALHILGTEERNDELYHRVLFYHLADSVTTGSPELAGLLREEDKRIYGYGHYELNISSPAIEISPCGDPNEEDLYFDFNQEPGDTINSCIAFIPDIAIDSTSSNVIFYEVRKVYHLSNAYDMQLIEGIGSNLGIIDGIGFAQHAAKGLYLRKHCIGSIDECVNLTSSHENLVEAFDIFPNPVQDQLTVKASMEQLDKAHIYNAQGQILIAQEINSELDLNICTSSLRPGYYILQLISKDNKPVIKPFIKS